MEPFQKYVYEDMKETPELAVAAHFTADPSKYNVKTHTHYSGNNIIIPTYIKYFIQST